MGLFSKNKESCFNCGCKLKKNKTYTVKINTIEGLMSVKACEKCGLELDEIVKEFEQVMK